MANKLPYDVFLKTFEHVPRLALNLIVTNPQMEVLLTKRAIPPGEGVWHYPGSYLLKNETLHECLVRIANDELGILIDPEKTKLLGLFENLNTDPRGHVVDALYGYTINESIDLKSNSETEEMKFFSKLPQNVGFNHRETLEKLGFK